MKNLTLKILRTGYSTSKKPLEDYTKYLYLLKYIFNTDSTGRVSCNDNPFWEHTNNDNRMDLYHDIMNMHSRKPTDNCYYRIINRFENGDKYGISTKVF